MKTLIFGFACVLAVGKQVQSETLQWLPPKKMNISYLHGVTKCKIITTEKTAPKQVNIIIKIFKYNYSTKLRANSILNKKKYNNFTTIRRT